MRRWVIGGAIVIVVGLVGALVLQLRGTTRFDDRAYSGSRWDMTADEVFADFDLALPECTDGRMRYWSGIWWEGLYMKITAPSDCVDQFIEVNRLISSEFARPGPVALASSAREAEFGWQSSADRKYTQHTRGKNWKNIWARAYVDDGTTERSLYLQAWHQ